MVRVMETATQKYWKSLSLGWLEIRYVHEQKDEVATEHKTVTLTMILLGKNDHMKSVMQRVSLFHVITWMSIESVALSVDTNSLLTRLNCL